MDEIRFSLANEFESGNYSKIIEIIQSKNNAESENQILLILALFKNNPKLARSKLHEILDNFGLGVLRKIILSLDLREQISADLMKTINSLSYNYPYFNINQVLNEPIAVSDLPEPAITSPTILGVVGTAWNPKTIENMSFLKKGIYLSYLLGKNQNHKGISKCHEYLAEFEKKQMKPPSKIYSYMVSFYHNMGDPLMALQYKRKYQERKIDENPSIREIVEKTLILLQDVFQEEECDQNLTPDNIEYLSSLTKLQDDFEPLSKQFFLDTIQEITHNGNYTNQPIDSHQLNILHNYQPAIILKEGIEPVDWDLKLNIKEQWIHVRRDKFKVTFGNNQQIKIILALLNDYPREKTFNQINDILYDEPNILTNDHYRRIKTDLRKTFGKVLFPKGEHASRGRLKAISLNPNAKIIVYK